MDYSICRLCVDSLEKYPKESPARLLKPKIQIASFFGTDSMKAYDSFTKWCLKAQHDTFLLLKDTHPNRGSNCLTCIYICRWLCLPVLDHRSWRMPFWDEKVLDAEPYWIQLLIGIFSLSLSTFLQLNRIAFLFSSSVSPHCRSKLPLKTILSPVKKLRNHKQTPLAALLQKLQNELLVPID